MTSILAIDTSTDACSVALQQDGEVSQRLEVQPRRHNQLLFPMLEEILGPGKRSSLDAIAFTSGPGSFTGLRVGCSAVQGLAFTLQLRCVPVSTLACLAQGAIRRGLADEGQVLLSLVDARVGELYFAPYRVQNGLACELAPPAVSKPQSMDAGLAEGELIAIGDGLALAEKLPNELCQRFAAQHGDLYPEARDLFPQAEKALTEGGSVAAQDVLPLYVRDEISWKKLSEQGPRA